MDSSIVITGMARTPLGALQGSLAQVPAMDLGAVVIAAAMARSAVDVNLVDEVLMGCVLPAGLGQAPARQAALAAGLPVGVAASTVNKVCGSGLKTVTMAADALLAGSAVCIVAGGMENMSRAPHMLSQSRGGYRLGHGALLDHMFTDGLQDAYSGHLMGVFAEATAEKYGFTREYQDAFALESLTRANKAISSGVFVGEIAAVTVKGRKGDSLVSHDEIPTNAQPAKIPSLRPAFKPDGTITAANASAIADGAAALVMMTETTAQQQRLSPLARLVAYAQYAQEPAWFTTAPVGAIKRVAHLAGWRLDEVDLFEINEAFAVVTLAAMHDLKLPAEKVNVHGGACALGHPLGASGARILVTLIAALEVRGLKKGIASLCIGGGEAIAVAVECF